MPYGPSLCRTGIVDQFIAADTSFTRDDHGSDHDCMQLVWIFLKTRFIDLFAGTATNLVGVVFITQLG